MLLCEGDKLQGAKSRETETTKEEVIISEARDDGDLGQVISMGGGERAWGSGQMPEESLMKLPNEWGQRKEG